MFMRTCMSLVYFTESETSKKCRISNSQTKMYYVKKYNLRAVSSFLIQDIVRRAISNVD